jgi:uncharacterized protein (TIGR03067 family)
MSRFLLLLSLALLAGCVHTPTVPARTGPLTGDEKRLQGSWVVVHSEVMHFRIPNHIGRIHIYEGRRFRIDTDTGSESFRIDEQSHPKRIDFYDGRNPDIQGIYAFEDDKLIICTADPGKWRPREFKSLFGTGIILDVLVRQRPTR